VFWVTPRRTENASHQEKDRRRSRIRGGRRAKPEDMVVQRQSDNLRKIGEIDKETVAVKCSKRGNDVYWWRVGKRIKQLYNLKETLFDPHHNFKSSNVIYLLYTPYCFYKI